MHPMSTATAPETRTVLVYSDDRTTRERIRFAIGRRPAADVPRVEYVECATVPAVLKALRAGGIDVAVFDGEAVPYGGIGLARQVKDEIFQCPPILVIVGRAQDGWLATWSRADAVISHPLDPAAVAAAVADLLRRPRRRVPVAS
jgi:DNA-binding response OmpR family regulator